ncbi:MAG: CAP domain-containing protein [Burkholderiales bacterium]|nr:CAP domain-containing protein [Burkholderiales bacterium]
MAAASLGAWGDPVVGDADTAPLTIEISGTRAGWQVDNTNRAAVRLFWRVRYRAAAPSGFWSGNLASCDPGETLPQHRLLTLARVNWFRAMAGVPADVQEDPAATRKTQAAALVVAANGHIAHDIDASWRCYSDDAHEGAHVSLLGSGSNGPEAVTNFIRDDGPQNWGGNHRRWLLYPQTRFMGVGDVPHPDKSRAASGFTAFDGLFGTNRPAVKHDFVAWPPPGWVPYQVVFPRWSFSLPDADFAHAKVTVSRDGNMLPVQIEPIDTGAGEPSLVWRVTLPEDREHMRRPDGDAHFHVAIDGVASHDDIKHYSYDVDVFDPDADPEQGLQTRVTRTGGGQTFRLDNPVGATGAEWRALHVSPWPLSEGAESGFGALSYTGSNDYPVIQTTVVASGSHAFRLAHTRLGDEILTLAAPVIVGNHGALSFKSRRGVAGGGEQAIVEVLPEGHDDWISLYNQTSDGRTASAETAFSAKRIDLAAYAGRTLRLRLRYAFGGGSYFSPDDVRVGWYIDDLRLDDAFRIDETMPVVMTHQNQFTFQPARPGDWRLQARPMVYGAPGDWGPLTAATTE